MGRETGGTVVPMVSAVSVVSRGVGSVGKVGEDWTDWRELVSGIFGVARKRSDGWAARQCGAAMVWLGNGVRRGEVRYLIGNRHGVIGLSLSSHEERAAGGSGGACPPPVAPRAT